MKALLLITLLISLGARAESIFVPNIPAYVTGTAIGGGHYGLDISGTVNATNPSVSATGAAVPASGTYAAGNKAGNLTGLLVGQQTMANSLACVLPSDQSAIPVTGTFWQATQPISAAALPLPSGASTSAKQPALGTAGTASSDVITIQGIASMTAVKVDGSAVTQPVSGTVTANAGTGTFTTSDSADGSVSGGSAGSKSILSGGVFNTAFPSLTNGQQAGIQLDSSGRQFIAPLTNASIVKAQLQDNAGTAVTLGQTTMSASLPVTLASNQSFLPSAADITTSGNIVTNGDTVVLATNSCGTVGFQITGAWTGTIQMEGSTDGTNFVAIAVTNHNLSASQSSTTANGSFFGPCGGFTKVRFRASAAITGTAVCTIVTSPVSSVVSAMALNQLNLLTSSVQNGTWTVQPGNTANTTAWLVTQQGRAQANAPVRNSYGSVNVTTSAWVQLVASTTSATSVMCVFDSSGQTLQIGTGAPASEIAQMIVFPGGNGCEPLKIASGTRVSIEALSGTANTGELDINFYQ